MAHGFDAVHVQEIGLRSATDEAVLSRAIAEDRIVVTNNADDFRKLGAGSPGHPGVAIILEGVGRARQLALGVSLANAIEAAGSAQGRLFEIDRTGAVKNYGLP